MAIRRSAHAIQKKGRFRVLTQRVREHLVSMLGAIAQFRTFKDVMLDGLKVEVFLPSDEHSAAFFEAFSGQ